MSFGYGFGRAGDIYEKIDKSPKIFYKVFDIYFNSGIKDATTFVRTTFNMPMMDSKKIIMMFVNEYTEDRIKEMLENIIEYSPEYTI